MSTPRVPTPVFGVRQRGAASLMAALFLLIVVAMAVVVALNLAGSDMHDTAIQHNSVQALFLAESGLERVGSRLRAFTCGDPVLKEFPIALGAGSFEVVSTAWVGSQCQVQVVGRFGQATRTVDAWFSGAGGAIALDPTGTGSVATTLATASVSLTIGSGANRLLVVGITSDKASGVVTSITYTTASSSATPVFLGTAGSGGNPGVDIYYLVNPPSGPGNLNLTMSAAGPIVVGAQVFTGVDQTTPINASAFSTGTIKSTTPSLAITTTAANTWLMSVLAVDKDVTGQALVPTGGASQIWLQAPAGNKITGGASQRGPVATPQTTSMDWTYSAPSQKWNIGVVALTPGGVPTLVGWREVVQ